LNFDVKLEFVFVPNFDTFWSSNFENEWIYFFYLNYVRFFWCGNVFSDWHWSRNML